MLNVGGSLGFAAADVSTLLNDPNTQLYPAALSSASTRVTAISPMRPASAAAPPSSSSADSACADRPKQWFHRRHEHQRGTLNFVNGALGGGTIAFNGGTLQWAAGNSADVSNRLRFYTASPAYLNTNGNNVTFTGNFGNTFASGVSVTKLGPGALVWNTTSAGTTRRIWRSAAARSSSNRASIPLV